MRPGRIVLALGAVAIAAARLHRLQPWETPLVLVGSALVVIGLALVIRTRRRKESQHG
jgi:membrane protein implicated in regulation of membrane protease activity